MCGVSLTKHLHACFAFLKPPINVALTLTHIHTKNLVPPRRRPPDLGLGSLRQRVKRDQCAFMGDDAIFCGVVVGGRRSALMNCVVSNSITTTKK